MTLDCFEFIELALFLLTHSIVFHKHFRQIWETEENFHSLLLRVLII